ncbi:MAG: galactofuranose ABC transporter, permease protein YjfF [Opitutaceae bacterium]
MRTPLTLAGRHLPLLATGVIFCLLFGVAAIFYEGFFSGRVLADLFSDNAVLGITAVGMTLVIFSGGIDLSIGAVIGFTSILVATLIARGVSPAVAWMVAMLIGTGFGAVMGMLIQTFRLPPFLITLAGMFLARGLGFWVSTESIAIQSPLYDRLSAFDLPLGGSMHLSSIALLFVMVAMVGYLVAHHTRFGRTLFAIGGNEQSAWLMGLPVGFAKVAVYAVNGLAAAFAGIVQTLYTSSGDSSKGVGLELDAIAVVVIGGTLLSGGRGHVFGTVLGVLIFGTIQAAILFDGRLSSWWMRIVVGALILVFTLLQRFIVHRARRGRG